MAKQGQPPDDTSSAPESGTVRDSTSGNQPSDRKNNPAQPDDRTGNPQRKDDPSVANEER